MPEEYIGSVLRGLTGGEVTMEQGRNIAAALEALAAGEPYALLGLFALLLVGLLVFVLVRTHRRTGS